MTVKAQPIGHAKASCQLRRVEQGACEVLAAGWLGCDGGHGKMRDALSQWAAQDQAHSLPGNTWEVPPMTSHGHAPASSRACD